MKKFNLFKKIGVSVLSLIVAGSIGGACLSSSNAQAAYDYSQVAKTDEYVEGLFSKNERVYATAGYTAPDYMNIDAKYSNGLLLNFDQTGAEVTSTKTYTVKELANAITFFPILDSEAAVQLTSPITEVKVTFVEESTSKSVTIKVSYNSKDWLEANWSGAAASARYLEGETIREQTAGGYAINAATALHGTPLQGNIYLRGGSNAGRIENGFAGSKTKTDPYKFGYIEYDTELIEDGEDQDTLPDEVSVGKRVAAITNKMEPNLNGKTIGNGLPINLNNNIKGYENVDFSGMSVLRYLNSQDGQYNLDLGGSVYDPILFNGFAENAQLKVKLSVSGGTGKILVSELAGENLSSMLRVENAYDAYVGYDYNIPTPKFYRANPNGDAFNGTIKVYDANKQEVNDANVKLGETKYNFKEAGTYTITYSQSYVSGGKTEKYSSNLVINVQSANANKVELKRTAVPTSLEKIKGMSFNAGASVSSPIYHKEDKSHIKLVVVKPSGSEETINNLPVDYPYTFNEAGNYKFKYYAIDDVFDAHDIAAQNKQYTRETVVDIFVESTYYALETNEYTIYAMGDALNNLKVDKNIVSFFDQAYGRNFFDNLTSLTFEVKEPNATEYRALTQSELDNGYEFSDDAFSVEYKFRYKLSYAVGSNVYTIPTASENKEYVEFTVYVIDGIQPSIFKTSEDYLYGASYVSNNGKIYNYRATTGSKVTFTKLGAYDAVGVNPGYISNDITVSLIKDGVSTATTLDNETVFDYTFDTAGEYIFKFDISDGYNENYLCFIIEVENEFYEIKVDESVKTEYSTNDVIKMGSLQVVNSNGVAVTNATAKFEVYFDGELVYEGATLNYNPTKAGSYEIKMLAQVNGVTYDEESYAFNVVDKTAPTITVGGTIVKQATVGDAIEIATIQAVDNNDGDTDLIKTIEITLNGSQINMFNGKFKPVESGVYVVKLISTDLSGNTATYVYEIDVLSNKTEEFTILGVDLVTFILGVVGVIMIVVAVIVLIAVLGKKKSTVLVESEVEEVVVEEDDE